MSTENPTPSGDAAGRQPTEQELLAAYEEQMKNVRVEEVLVQSLASFIELGGRRAGLAGGSGAGEAEAGPTDAAQLGLAIEVIRALQPLAAPLLGPNARQIDQALSQLQVAYAKLAGGGEGGGAGGTGGGGATGGGGGTPGTGGPANSPASGGAQQPPAADRGPSRLWVPGQ